jgi:hypothetical protein
MSQKCEKLHEILKEGKKFYARSLDDANVKNELNHSGLYIFYEEGETGHGGDRIVRVGRAIKTDTIYKRNKQHFFGTKRRSIFRKQIGRAILCNDSERLDNWNTKGKPDGEIEKKVSRHLAEKCHFIAIAIEDIEKVNELEKKMTATVVQCNEYKPSKGWLGYNSPQNKIRKYGLWQEQSLNGEELSEDDLAEIEKHLIKA